MSANVARVEGKRRIENKYDDNTEEPNYEELKDTAGVKVIRYDEDIRAIFCAQNTSPFGYIAILGQDKLCIYLAYADEASAMYDHIWTIRSWDFRSHNLGPKV